MRPHRLRTVLLLAVLVFAGGCSRDGGLDNIRQRLDEKRNDQPRTEVDVQAPSPADANQTARVGLIIATNSPSWERLVDAPADPGVVVLFVQPGGPADGTGIQTGDVIIEVDGEPSRNAERAVTQLRAPPDVARTLSVAKRGGESREQIDVTARVPGQVNLVDMYTAAIEQAPDDPVLRFLRAQHKDYTDAMKDVEVALEEAPGFVEGLSLRAELNWNKSRNDQELPADTAEDLANRALSDWSTALELDANNTRVLGSRSQAQTFLNSRDGERDARKAIEIDDTFPLGHYALGVAHFVFEEYAEAAAPLRKAIDLNPYDVRYYEALAYTFVQLGHRDRAQSTVDAILPLIDDAATRQLLEGIPSQSVDKPSAPRGADPSSNS